MSFIFRRGEDRNEQTEQDELSYLHLSSTDLLCLLGGPEARLLSYSNIRLLCVCDICEALDLNQTTVSNQLRILRANNIVKYQKEGKLARYSLTDLHIEMIYKVGLEHILE